MRRGTFCPRFSSAARGAGATAHRGSQRVRAGPPCPPTGRPVRRQARVPSRPAATGLSPRIPPSPLGPAVFTGRCPRSLKSRFKTAEKKKIFAPLLRSINKISVRKYMRSQPTGFPDGRKC